MTTRADFVAEARRWLDTPFAHQAHTRGVGTDCGGLVVGVGIACGLAGKDWWEVQFKQHAGYSRIPSNAMLERICHRFMRPIEIDAAREGDILLMRFEKEPQHVAILAPYLHGGLSVIHAYSRAGKVVEHRFSSMWRARVTEAFSIPGVV